jgi:hypothetical protein
LTFQLFHPLFPFVSLLYQGSNLVIELSDVGLETVDGFLVLLLTGLVVLSALRGSGNLPLKVLELASG